jgi:hypothetical protein
VAGKMQNATIDFAICKYDIPILQLYEKLLTLIRYYWRFLAMITMTLMILGWELRGIGFEA